MSKVYLIPTFRCNLACGHCDIRKQNQPEKFSEFLESTRKIRDGELILFGGEPLLIGHDKLIETLNANDRITSITTNLLMLDDRYVGIFKEYGLSVATSWNPSRFTAGQYGVWLQNIEKLLKDKIDVTVLITLTYDLFGSAVSNVLEDLNRVQKANSEYFSGVAFEPYVEADEALVRLSDRFLVGIHRDWRYDFVSLTARQYGTGRIIRQCNGILTVLPSGRTVNGCPTGKSKYVLNQCMTCEYNSICKPCQKQRVCTFFKMFYGMCRKERQLSETDAEK